MTENPITTGNLFSTPDPMAQLRAAIGDVFLIDDVTLADGAESGVIRFRGRFLADPEHTYPQVRERFRQLGYTPFFRKQGGQQVIIAAPGVVLVRPSRSWINVALFVLTVISVWWVGATMMRDTDTPPRNLLDFILGGLPYAASLIGILLVHELGHYFMARRYGVAVTLPYFIPLPPFLIPNLMGTMGAAIMMKEPMPNRKIVFDIGVAGPIAGLFIAIPVLIYGLSLSTVGPLPRGTGFILEGNSLFYIALKYLMFGQVLPSVCVPGAGVLDCLRRLMLGGALPANAVDVTLHPIAFAGWAGLLVTMLNLLPASQLDGGHVSYTLFGERSRYVSMGLSITLLLLSLALFPVVGFDGLTWALWAGLIYFFGWRHPPTLNELVPLDTPRRLLAVLILILFVLLFMPVPLRTFVR